MQFDFKIEYFAVSSSKVKLKKNQTSMSLARFSIGDSNF